jgi:hypothetical protein
MGLDTTHGCWHGAYSAFHRWRTEVAQAAGYGEQWPNRMLIHGGEKIDDIHNGDWVRAPDDPLLVLLLHQDCDGHIRPEHAGPLADRLEAIMGRLDEDWRAMTCRFIAGLREAAARGETVIFQ